MDDKTKKVMVEFWKEQKISESDIDWLTGFTKALQRKSALMFAKQAHELLKSARENGADHDSPASFDFSIKAKAFIDDPSVVKAEFALSWSKPHKEKDMILAEVSAGGDLLEQSDMFEEQEESTTTEEPVDSKESQEAEKKPARKRAGKSKAA